MLCSCLEYDVKFKPHKIKKMSPQSQKGAGMAHVNDLALLLYTTRLNRLGFFIWETDWRSGHAKSMK